MAVMFGCYGLAGPNRKFEKAPAEFRRLFRLLNQQIYCQPVIVNLADQFISAVAAGKPVT